MVNIEEFRNGNGKRVCDISKDRRVIVISQKGCITQITANPDGTLPSAAKWTSTSMYSFLYLTASAIAIASKKVQKISRTVLPFRKIYHIFRPFTSFPAESRPEQLALLWWDNRSYSPHRVLCQQYARRRTHGVEYRRTPDSGNGGDRPDIA